MQTHGSSSNGNSILAQLSGLRLSDGSTAGDRIKFQTTPPSAAKSGGASMPSGPSTSSNAAPAAAVGTRFTDVSKLLSSGVVHVGSPPPQVAGASTAAPAGDSNGKGKGGSSAIKMKDGKVVALPRPRSELHPRQQDTPSVAAAASPSPSKAHKAAAKKAGVPLEPAAGLNAKLTELFHKHPDLTNNSGGGVHVAMVPAATSSSPSGPAAAASSSSHANPHDSSNSHQGAAAAAASTAAAAASSSSSSRGPTAEEKKAALRTNQFLLDAFGLIDNTDAERPIIRSLPKVLTGGRYIVVGDVHGCVDQLEALIEKVRYEKGKDCLVIIGDYVNKGPDSVGVVRACIKHGALGVLGNHDYTLLKCIDKHRRKPFRAEDMKDPVKQLAKAFPIDCEYYLRGLPHILKLPEYNALIVHAGLNTQHQLLEDQNVYELMHLRRLEKLVTNDPQNHKKEKIKYQAVIKGSAGVPWGELWEGPEQVIFGHDAYSGFQVHPKATGIDTGCVYGDPLTCVVFAAGSPQGEYFNVPGLPKSTNELKGLPPPDSAIYEQQQLELERQIIRPTPRATPSLASAGGCGAGSPASQRPVFLSTPVSLASPPPTRSLTATVTSTNARLTPSSTSAAAAAFPSRAMTPTTASVMGLSAAMAQEVADVSAREVQKATLLALSAAQELSALGVVLAMPVYENSLEIMLCADANDRIAVESFWTPFIRNILAAAGRRIGAGAAAEVEEEALLYALGVCDDLEDVRKSAVPQLQALLETNVNDKLPKSARKYVEVLMH